MSDAGAFALWVLMTCVVALAAATCVCVSREAMDDAALWYLLTVCLLAAVLWLLMCVDVDSGPRVVDWEAFHEHVREVSD